MFVASLLTGKVLILIFFSLVIDPNYSVLLENANTDKNSDCLANNLGDSNKNKVSTTTIIAIVVAVVGAALIIAAVSPLLL